MFRTIRRVRRPFRDFLDFHNKTLLIPVFLKIEENYEQQAVAHVNVRNFCLKQIPQKSTLKKFSKNKNTLLAPVFWEIEENGQRESCRQWKGVQLFCETNFRKIYP